MKGLTAATGLGLALLAIDASAALPRALDGSWYNPLQSGHGLTLESVDADSAVLFWHVFDPDGRPLTLYIDGRVDGRVVYGEAYAPTGMPFGSFSTTDFSLPYRGEVTLTFSDCSNAQLQYRSEDPAYGAGSMRITRLLPLPERACDLALPSDFVPLIAHEVRGEFERTPELSHGATGLQGLVGTDGSLFLHASDFDHPADDFDSILVGRPQPGLPGAPQLRFEVYPNHWYCGTLGGTACSAPMPDSPPRFELASRIEPTRDGLRASATSRLAAGIDDTIAPRVHLWTRARFARIYGPPLGSYPIQQRIGADSGNGTPPLIQFDTFFAEDRSIRIMRGNETIYTGQVTSSDPHGFDFELLPTQRLRRFHASACSTRAGVSTSRCAC